MFSGKSRLSLEATFGRLPGPGCGIPFQTR